MQKKNIFFENNTSIISGCNYGEYPIHKFRTYNMMDHEYPVYAESGGDDLWHFECRRERKNSDVFSIEYVQEGVFIFNHGEEKFETHPGEIFLLHLGSSSAMRCKTLTARKKVIIMAGDALPEILNSTGLDRISHIKLADRSKVDRIFAALAALEISGSGTENSMLCYELLLILAEQAVTAYRPPELHKALDLIQRSLDISLTLNDLAAGAGVSNATLNRMFHKYFCCAPMAYFRKLRMEKVQNLLKYYPVKSVAAMMNFSSTQYLAGEVKKYFGVSPKSFRQRL